MRDRSEVVIACLHEPEHEIWNDLRRPKLRIGEMLIDTGFDPGDGCVAECFSLAGNRDQQAVRCNFWQMAFFDSLRRDELVGFDDETVMNFGAVYY